MRGVEGLVEGLGIGRVSRMVTRSGLSGRKDTSVQSALLKQGCPSK